MDKKHLEKHRSLSKTSSRKPQKLKRKETGLKTNTFCRCDKEIYREDTPTHGSTSPPHSRSPSPSRPEAKIKDKNPSRSVKFSPPSRKKIQPEKPKKYVNVASEVVCECPSDSNLSEDCNEEEKDKTDKTGECCDPNCYVSDLLYPNSSLDLKETKSETNFLSSSKESFERSDERSVERIVESKQLNKKEKVYCECNSHSDIEISPSHLHPGSRKRPTYKRLAPLKKSSKEKNIPVKKNSRRYCAGCKKEKAQSTLKDLFKKCSEDLFSSKSKKQLGSNLRPLQLSASTSTESMDEVKSGLGARNSYDPYNFRVVEKPTNYFETLVHLVKCSLGTGILAMPQAFANSGFLIGIIFTAIIGIIITHCVAMLIRAQYILCKQKRVPVLSYAEAMSAAMELGPGCLKGFSRLSGIIVNIFIIMLQLGICCVYIVFVAGTIKQIVDPHYVMRIETHMVIILGPLLLANCIPNLKVLAPFSLLANILIISSVAITIYFLLTGTKKTTESIDMWGSIYTFPLFFGTVLFSLLSVAVVVSLEGNMKSPKDMLSPFGVLNVGMILILLLYVSTGAIGYLFCKSQCSDSIVFDLPQNNPVTIAVLVMYAIAMIISYVLQCYVPIEIIWKSCMQKRLQGASRAKQTFWEYFLRIAVCVFTFALAAAFPRVGLIISLVGALCLSSLTIIFPVTMDLCIKIGNYGPFNYILYKNVLLFVVGLVGFVVGTTTAVIAMIDTFTKK